MSEQELFREVTVRVCGSLDLAAALGQAYPVFASILPLDEIRVNVLDRKMHAVKTIAIVDPSGTRNLIHSPLVLPIPDEVETELAGDSLDDVRIVGRVEEDRASSSVRTEYFSDVPESSLLIMRLFLDGERQGVILFRAVGTDRYTEAHKSIVSTLNEPIAIAVNNAIVHHELEEARRELAEENRYLAAELRGDREIVGASFGLAEVMELVSDVAPTSSPVLLLGETGVGKEVIADAIHRASPRRDGPFVKVNCGAIPDQLVDSELFGHEKGAFTGAVARKIGRFERANGGTLFLDEIGDLPLDAQVRLLRVLQSKEFERVGGGETIRTDARIVAATHRDMKRLVEDGVFRQDLWYRIGVFPITIPPLRERRPDIPALVNHFVERKSLEMGIASPPPLARGAIERLTRYSWPGNVRELANAVERELITNRGGELRFDSLGDTPDRADTDDRAGDEHRADGRVPRPGARPADESARFAGARRTGTPVHPGDPDNEHRPASLDEAIAAHIRAALEYAGGTVGGDDGAAAILGVNPSTLRHRMRKLGIRFGRQR